MTPAEDSPYHGPKSRQSKAVKHRLLLPLPLGILAVALLALVAACGQASEEVQPTATTPTAEGTPGTPAAETPTASPTVAREEP